MRTTPRFSIQKPILFALAAGSTIVACFCGYFAYETVGKSTVGWILPYENLYIGAFSQGTDSQSGLDYHDRILAIDGRRVRDAHDFNRLVDENPDRQRFEIDVQSPSGEIQSHAVERQRLGPGRAYLLFTPLLATGIAFLIIALLVLLIQPSPKGASAFVLYCLTTATYLLCGYDFHTTYRMIPILFVSIALMPATIVHLSLEFPAPVLPNLSRRIRFAAYGLAIAILIPYLALFRVNPRLWKYAEYAVFFYISSAYLGWLWSLTHRFRNDEDPWVQRQCRSILFGLVIGFGAIFLIMWANFVFGVPIPLVFVAPLCLSFPIAIVVAMFRSNLFLVQHLESQVQERTERLRQKELELFQAHKLASIGLLASGTAHEIGNAMNVVISNLSVLKKYADGFIAVLEGQKTRDEIDYAFARGDLPQLLDDLGKSSDRVLQIMANLRHFAKPETTRKTQESLASIADTTLHLLGNKVPAGIRIERAFESRRPVTVSAGQLHQVVLNLLLNAIDASGGKGTIRLRAFEEGGFAKLWVEDDGPGVPEASQDKIFDPFYTTKPTGTGLGLSVSHGILRDHGGSLRFEPAPRGGARFILAVPFEVQSPS